MLELSEHLVPRLTGQLAEIAKSGGTNDPMCLCYVLLWHLIAVKLNEKISTQSHSRVSLENKVFVCYGFGPNISFQLSFESLERDDRWPRFDCNDDF